MTDKIEVSRDLLEALIASDFAEDCQECGIGQGEPWKELRALLAAPAVNRQEPVAWMYRREGGEILGQLVQMESDELKVIRLGKFHDNRTRYLWPREDYIEWRPLYTSPPAPVAVVLPIESDFYLEVFKIYGFGPDNLCMLNGEDLKKLWNACLDKIKQLNKL